jgi:hypothetical protein
LLCGITCQLAGVLTDHIKVNLKKLAELGPYANPASANACWHTLKKKLLPAEGAAPVELTENDRKLLGWAWQCFEGTPNVSITLIQQRPCTKIT